MLKSWPMAHSNISAPRPVILFTKNGGLWLESIADAGMVHGLLQGELPAQTLTRATAIAAQAVTQVGFGIRDREQLARLEAAVQLTEQQEGCR